MSPPSTPRVSVDLTADSKSPTSWQILTPPSSTKRSRTSSNSFSAMSSPSTTTSKFTEDNVLESKLSIDYSSQEVFGSGAWSTVYKCHAKPHTPAGIQAPFDVMTPPSSPISKAALVVAVKTAISQDAVRIIRQEAKVLSHLNKTIDHEQYIARFYGIVDKTSSIVLQGYPISLEAYIKQCAKDCSNPRAAVIGSTKAWLNLASRLISGLDWLHNTAEVLHGDIKPGNIMLEPSLDLNRTEDTVPFKPLFIDFSSSQIMNEPITKGTLSAVTKEYTAPELLKASILRDPMSCATTASDIFSMGVTLLVAATGDTMVYSGYESMQRQILATQGNSILSNVSSPKVPRKGIIWQALAPAFLIQNNRITTREWVGKVEEELQKQ